MKDFLTDQGVEVEIERLRESHYVKLAKKEEALRYRRRQYMYQLRAYEKKGRKLEAQGYTLDNLEEMMWNNDD